MSVKTTKALVCDQCGGYVTIAPNCVGTPQEKQELKYARTFGEFKRHSENGHWIDLCWWCDKKRKEAAR